MSYLLDLWQLEGDWIVPIKFSFIGLCILSLVDLVTRGRFRLLNVSIALFVILLFCGFLGTLAEIMKTFESMAVPSVSPDKKGNMIYAGLSGALDYSILSIGLAIPCLWLMALSRVIRKEEQSIDSKVPTH